MTNVEVTQGDPWEAVTGRPVVISRKQLLGHVYAVKVVVYGKEPVNIYKGACVCRKSGSLWQGTCEYIQGNLCKL